MKPDRVFAEAMLAAEPSLKAFAVSLCGNVDRAHDLVQETLLRAWANKHTFEPGTNMPAWLFTILRNFFRSEYRKRRREVEDPEDLHAGTLVTQPAQFAKISFDEVRSYIDKLPDDQREALLIVGAAGFSYEEAAELSGCAIGTIKSRVHRARQLLIEKMCLDAEDFSNGHAFSEMPVNFAREARLLNGSRQVSKQLEKLTTNGQTRVMQHSRKILLLGRTKFVLSRTQRLVSGIKVRIFVPERLRKT